ncbi:MAG: hypothetical protein IK092_07765, partial [Muribaculaceae bacterium]|nr:hypothetical protein [Muribaculaceae bacterium]
MKIKHFFIAACLVAGAALCAQADDNKSQTVVNMNGTIEDLENDIDDLEESVEAKRDSIKDIEKRIKVLKERVDSLNDVEKDVKNQISKYEKEKQALENGIKKNNEARKAVYEQRDMLVFDHHVRDVLLNRYNKEEVVSALKHFDAMETKDIIKYKELLEDYGKYTQNLRQFLEKQRGEFEAANWTHQAAESETVKNFHKGLKNTKYWKTYDNRVKKPYRSIGYLDKVMDAILTLERQGFD